MKRAFVIAALGVQLIGIGTGIALAADLPSYKPPPRGAPTGRIGMGSRGVIPVPYLWALAPEHTGLTTREQPSLYWYTTMKSVPVRIELTAITKEGTNTVLEESAIGPASAGVQRIDLSRYGVRLQPGVEYSWMVHSERDPKQRSKRAAIQRIAASPELAKRIETAPKSGHAAIYAEEGIWYDALSSIGELIEQSPNDAALRMQRAALLEQVGLKEAAAGDATRQP